MQGLTSELIDNPLAAACGLLKQATGSSDSMSQRVHQQKRPLGHTSHHQALQKPSRHGHR